MKKVISVERKTWNLTYWSFVAEKPSPFPEGNMLARHPAPYCFHSVPLLAVWISAERPHILPAAILLSTFTLAAATLPTSPGPHTDL